MSSDILFSEDKTELCLDEARRMLHISKRKCAELLKDGVLPCKSTGKKTRQYRILLSDVEALVQTQDHKKPCEPQKYDRRQLEDQWHDVSEVLTPADVQKLTGYSQSYVSLLMISGKLRSVTVYGSPITSKEWLIEFMCGDRRKRVIGRDS